MVIASGVTMIVISSGVTIIRSSILFVLLRKYKLYSNQYCCLPMAIGKLFKIIKGDAFKNASITNYMDRL